MFLLRKQLGVLLRFGLSRIPSPSICILARVPEDVCKSRAALLITAKRSPGAL